MQVLIPSKCIMHKHAKDKIFLYFYNGWYVNAIKKDSITPKPCIKYQTQAKQDTEIKRSNALISKQKRRKMTITTFT